MIIGLAPPTQNPGLEVQPSSSNNSVGSLRRDPDYYFEDGSITFQINNVLFKVHMSLLKLHSDDFERAFELPPANTESRYHRISNPIIIPDVMCYQFRHLMKVIYCKPTDQIFLPPPSVYSENKDAARNFIFYVDVARLSRKFAMGGIEIWARQRLAQLVHKGGDHLYAGFADFTFAEIGRDKDDVSEGTGRVNEGIRNACDYAVFSVFEAIRYASNVFDSSLYYDCLHFMQYFHGNEERDIRFALSFFRIPSLREEEPSLFGYFFLLILSAGNRIWMDNIFTRTDRMALFSAQSFLAPLPDSLKTPLATPLLEALDLETFTQMFSDSTVGQMCVERCYHTAFLHWEITFEEHYKKLVDRDPRIPITALTKLPVHRRRLTSLLQKDACARECYRVILGITDQAIEDLYYWLATYYKPID